MPTRQPDFLLDVGRTQNLRVHHRLGKITAEPTDRAEHTLLHRFPPRFPIAISESIRNVLRENAHTVKARGHNVCIVDALEIQFCPKPFADRTGAGSLETVAPFRLGERSVDLPMVMCFQHPWSSLEVGKLPQKDVQLNGATDHRNGLHLRAPQSIRRIAQQP